MGPAPMAFGALAGLAAAFAFREAAGASPAMRAWFGSSLAPLRRARIEGYVPTSRERLRIVLLLGLAAIALGWYLAGIWLALILVAASPVFAGYLIGRSRRRYRGLVEAALPDAARAIADGLAAGHSPRGALMAVPVSLDGPAAVEFNRLRHDLDSGASSVFAINQISERFHSARVDAFCSALISQRLAGGDLAALLRRFAAGAAERDRINEDARAATAQARFTGYLVVSMPLGAALFAEVMRPGFLASLAGSLPALVLLAVAAAFQAAGFIAIARLARIEQA